VFAIAVE